MKLLITLALIGFIPLQARMGENWQDAKKRYGNLKLMEKSILGPEYGITKKNASVYMRFHKKTKTIYTMEYILPADISESQLSTLLDKNIKGEWSIAEDKISLLHHTGRYMATICPKIIMAEETPRIAYIKLRIIDLQVQKEINQKLKQKKQPDKEYDDL